MRPILVALVLTSCISKPSDPGPSGASRTWTKRDNADQPGPAVSPRLTYDAKRERVIMYTSDPDNVSAAPDDAMYQLDDTGWTKLCGPCLPDHGRFAPGFAYDPTHDRLLLFDGAIDRLTNSLDQVWQFADRTWTLIGPATNSSTGDPGPTAREWTQLVFDAKRAQIVLLGGYFGSNVQSDTWTFDGTSKWTKLATPPEMPEMFGGGQTAAYDPVRGRIIVFADGASGQGDSLWSLTNNKWSIECSECVSPSRGDTSLAYLPDYEQTFVIGGATRDSCGTHIPIPGTWQVLTSSANLVDPIDLPARRNFGTVYDPVRDVVVAYGGIGCGDVCAETWEYVRTP